jgi:hypothetical protein
MVRAKRALIELLTTCEQSVVESLVGIDSQVECDQLSHL